VIQITFPGQAAGNHSTSAQSASSISAVIRSFKRKINPRSVMALALIFWCAGAGCMIVSYARASMTEAGGPSNSVDQVMAGMSSSMDAAHACCKAQHRSKNRSQLRAESPASSEFLAANLLALPSTPTQSGAMSCCPLTSGSIVVGSRSQSDDHANALDEAGSSSLLLIKSNPPPLAVPLRLPNRANAYLLDCAFLI
jgi:hypothetical protein